MTSTTIIQYRTKPERAEENQRLIEAVVAGLALTEPADFQYAVYRGEDGVTFVHVVRGDAGVLAHLPEFQAFQRGSADRLEGASHRTTSTLIGSYGS